MGQRLTDIPFDEWLKHVFDHDLSDPAWYWDLDADHWAGPPTTTAQFITRLFENADQLLRPFSDAQLNQGLWYIVSHACSSMMLDVLHESRVPRDDRRRCLSSILSLFRQCFAVRCSEHLSHQDGPGAKPLNSVCYMWWDIFPTWGNPDDPSCAEQDQQLLDVMANTLAIPSVACRESALHGLGHWQHQYPDEVENIIDAFLGTAPDIRPDLAQYAFSARQGHVL
jgi:hypothetical protein